MYSKKENKVVIVCEKVTKDIINEASELLCCDNFEIQAYDNCNWLIFSD